MTVADHAKLEDQLGQLSVSDGKKTNLVKLDLKPRQCAGRVNIELGEVTQHNIQQIKRLNEAVCYFFKVNFISIIFRSFPVNYKDLSLAS